jgi:enterochelin esterase-like enzyme
MKRKVIKPMSQSRRVSRMTSKVSQRDLLNSYITDMLVSQMWITDFINSTSLALTIPIGQLGNGKKIPYKLNCSLTKLEDTKQHEQMTLPEDFEL